MGRRLIEALRWATSIVVFGLIAHAVYLLTEFAYAVLDKIGLVKPLLAFVMLSIASYGVVVIIIALFQVVKLVKSLLFDREKS